MAGGTCGGMVGSLRHVHMYAETTWGDKPSSPAYIHLPHASYNARFRSETRKSALFTGLMAKKHNQKFRGMVTGQLTLPLFGYVRQGQSLARHILDWGLNPTDPDNQDYPSKGFQVAESVISSSKEQNGVRVNQLTITGSDSAPEISMSLDIVGKTEVNLTTLQTVPDDMEKLLNFDFKDTTLVIDSVTTKMASFSFVKANGMRGYYLNSSSLTCLPKTSDLVTLSLVVVKDANTYEAEDRGLSPTTEHSITLTFKGLHNGTGTGGTNWTVITMAMPRCSMEPMADDTIEMEGLIFQTLNFICLKPDDTQKQYNLTYTEAA